MNPSSFAGAIVIGVFSGVITSLVLFGLVRVFRLIVIPWYQNIIYRGIKIDGEWEIGDSRTMQSTRITLTQHADTLKGTCIFIRRDVFGDDEQFEAIRNFALVGRISDRFVELSFRHADQRRLGVGVFVLEVVGDGRRMHGQQTFYSVYRDEISSSAVTVQRHGIVRAKSRQLELKDLSESDVDAVGNVVDRVMRDAKDQISSDDDTKGTNR